MGKLDERVRSRLAAGHTGAATTVGVREIGLELLDFPCGVLGDTDADEVFLASGERRWRSRNRNRNLHIRAIESPV